MITTGFTFDLKGLQGTEGFPEAAKKMVESQGGRLDRMSAQQRAEMTKLRGWTSQAYGMFAEYEVTKMLERVFSSEPCCLLNSFVENQLVNVAKEALDPGYSKKNNDTPLSPEVRYINTELLLSLKSSRPRLCGVFCVSRISRRSRKKSSLGSETFRLRREGLRLKTSVLLLRNF